VDANDINGRGLSGDGQADDTAALRAILANAALTGSAVELPPGVYVVAPTQANGIILPMSGANLRIVGGGIGRTVIRVATGALAYRAILNGAVPGLRVEGVTFDHNVAGNPLFGAAELVSGPRYTIEAAGGDLSIVDCEITNASSLNDLALYGSGISVLGCLWTNYGDDPSHVAHDSSCIYAQSADEVRVEGCRWIGAYPGAPGARTAIEVHSSRNIISRNFIRDFAHGINLTGVAIADSVGHVVADNVMHGVGHGIRIFSSPYSTHVSGFGIDGAVVANNFIGMARTGVWSDSANGMFGIVTDPAAGLDVRGLLIYANVIESPLEAEVVASNSASCGIGWFSVAGKAFHDSSISENTIIGFPMAGIRLSCDVRGCNISGNRLTNCGSTLDQTHPAAYRTPIFIATTGNRIYVERNKIADTNAVTRNAYGMQLFLADAAMAYVIDNFVDVTGDGQAFVAAAYLQDGSSPILKGLYSNGVDVTPA